MIDYTSKLTEDFLLRGKSDSCPIIDTHAHMFNCYECNMLLDTPEKQLIYMDRSGVELALFISHDALYGGYPMYKEDLEVCKRYPGRFRMYIPVFSPDCDPQRDIDFAEKNPEVIGWKFHADTYHIPLSDSRHDPYYAYADERRLPVLFHTWGGSPYDGEEEARKVLDKYHSFPFIAGHSFVGHVDHAIAMAQEYPNLYLELTAVLSHEGMVDRFVAAGLEDKILFGVDSPWFAYSFGIGALLSAEMTDDQRRKILSGNARRILKEAGVL